MNRLTCAETAKIVRACLREAFPAFKFKVRSSTYANGASINILCPDGPTERQVEDVVKHLQSAYFDAMIDYQGRVYHMLDGQQISLGADYISAIQGGKTFDVRPLPSPTAKRYMVIGDDGYSRSVGSGVTAVLP